MASRHKQATGHGKTTARPGVDQVARDVGHLMRRAGFGGTPMELDQVAQTGVKATLDRLVNYEQVPDDFVPPDSSTIAMIRSRQSKDLAGWWLDRMINTSRPFQEKMTLFWHGHFATSISKVRSPLLMFSQNQLFRTQGMGRFDALLSAVYKDPAMLIWLDGQRNTRQAPNENWGREVMELFTLGRGNYTEDDVHACSRAFTGWRLDANQQPTFIPRLHDDGPKTLLGQTGSWNAEDAVRILADHPSTGPFLAARLWKFFASDRPSQAAIKKISDRYYSSGHGIRDMAMTMFSLPEFYGSATRTGHIKSPAEFLVTTIRQLGLQSLDSTNYPRVLSFLGQTLFDPPNVGGWPGGPVWINASTMLGRFNFASSLTGDAVSRNPTTSRIDTQAILQASNAEAMPTLAESVAAMLGIELTQSTWSALEKYAGTGPIRAYDDVDSRIRGLVHLALVSPEYQAS